MNAIEMLEKVLVAIIGVVVAIGVVAIITAGLYKIINKRKR